MKSILIGSITHNKHRYETVGDWYDNEIKESDVGTRITDIEVSEMSDVRYELLVAIHELVEKVLCDNAGVTEQQVDEFDMKFESIREYERKSRNYTQGEVVISEPGDDLRAPYHRQHKLADVIERLLAIELGVDWETYNDEVNTL